MPKFNHSKTKKKPNNKSRKIGGGEDASYEIVGIDELDADELIQIGSLERYITTQTKPKIVKRLLVVTPKGNEKKKRKIFFEIIEHIGEGAFGSVDLIQNIENKNYYIFKIGKDNEAYDSYNEGIQSNMLKGIIDDDMLVLYQGKSKKDFLISHYNGKNLKKKYTIDKLKLCEDYKNITVQILDLLYRINSKNIFHNDIKPDNLTIKKGKVYLIDYGLLGNRSSGGSLMSMPFKSVIRDCEVSGFHKYREYHPYLLSILIDTDIFGFFYCCISLLLFINNKIGIWDIFTDLKIKKDIGEDSMYNIFKLYYFILPESKRTIDELNKDSNAIYGTIFGSSDYIDLFGSVPPENANLFKFMSYIYYKLDYYLLSGSDERNIYFSRKHDRQNLIEFLRVLSDCLLPNFQYANFIIQYNKAVSLLFQNYLFVNLNILNSMPFYDY